MILDLEGQSEHIPLKGSLGPYWNPMWEWIMMPAQSNASMTGFRLLAAKGAMVRGMSAADMALWVQSACWEIVLETLPTVRRPNDSCRV